VHQEDEKRPDSARLMSASPENASGEVEGIRNEEQPKLLYPIRALTTSPDHGTSVSAEAQETYKRPNCGLRLFFINPCLSVLLSLDFFACRDNFRPRVPPSTAGWKTKPR
jgi:hypothetical protein